MAAESDIPMNRGRLVQARHTASEQLVYRTLRATGGKQEDGSCITAISYIGLALVTGRHVRTIERAIDGLIHKGALQVVAKGCSGSPANCRVLSYRQILERNVGPV